MTIATSSPTSRQLANHRSRPATPRRDEIRIPENAELRAELREEKEECHKDTTPISRFMCTIITDLLKTGVFRKTSIYVSPNTAVLDAYNNAYDAVQEIVTAHTAS